MDRSIQAELGTQGGTVKAIQAGRLVLIRFAESEKAFLRAVGQPRSGATWKDGVVSAWDDLMVRRAAVDKMAGDLKTRIGGKEDLTLEGAYRTTVGRMRGEADKASQLVRTTLLNKRRPPTPPRKPPRGRPANTPCTAIWSAGSPRSAARYRRNLSN